MSATTHQRPTEIMAPPLPMAPRRVRIKRWRWLPLLFIRLFLLPHTLVGLFLIGNVVRTAWVNCYGHDASAIYGGSRTTHSAKGGTHIYGWYTFAADGKTHRGEMDLQEQESRSLRPLDVIAVKYATFGGRLSSEVQLPGRGFWEKYGRGAMFAIFWNSGMAIFVYAMYVRPFRQRWLLRTGDSTPGRITKKRSESSGRSKSYVLYYASDDEVAEAIEGKMLVWKRDYARFQVGDGVNIVFDPGKPKRNIAFEPSDYELMAGGE